jgi:hypothetical protein
MKYLAIIAALAASSAIGYRVGKRVCISKAKAEADAIHADFNEMLTAIMKASQQAAPVTPEPIATDTKAPATPDDWNKAFIVDMRREGNC